MTGTHSQVIRRIERAYRDRDGCRLCPDEVVILSLVHEIADAEGVAADLDADDHGTIELRGGGECACLVT